MTPSGRGAMLETLGIVRYYARGDVPHTRYCYLPLPMSDLVANPTDTRASSRAATAVGATVPLWTLLLPVGALLLLVLVTSQRPDGRLHMWVLDVGQGDAIFIRTAKGHTALVDGGPAATPLLNGIGEHLPFWQRSIDMVVLTHPHEDHVMGLIDVLKRYRVGEVVETMFTSTLGVQGEWLHDIKATRVPVHYAGWDDIISFEDEPDVAFRVLSPATPDAERELTNGDVNNTSVVLKLSYGRAGILLEGDAQWEAEGEMERHEASYLPSTVLKVGHHGSDTSSSPDFLRVVSPAVAIISVGLGNKYSHPAPATLDALRQSGATVYRTDLDGTVEIIADKETMWVRSQR